MGHLKVALFSSEPLSNATLRNILTVVDSLLSGGGGEAFGMESVVFYDGLIDDLNIERTKTDFGQGQGPVTPSLSSTKVSAGIKAMITFVSLFVVGFVARIAIYLYRRPSIKNESDNDSEATHHTTAVTSDHKEMYAV